MDNSSTLPEKVAKFRHHYRQQYLSKRYSGWLHLSFTLFMATSVCVYCALQLDNVSAYQWLVIPLTFLYANLVEYFAHRFPMHRPFPGIKLIFRRHARQHHRFFTDSAMQFEKVNDFKAVLFPPYLILFFFVFFALPVGLLLGLFFSDNIAYLFVLSAFGYFLNYELLHTAYHLPEQHWVLKLPFLMRLRKLHLHHHNQKLMSHHNFNITYPICDKIFGTYYTAGKNDSFAKEGDTHSVNR